MKANCRLASLQKKLGGNGWEGPAWGRDKYETCIMGTFPSGDGIGLISRESYVPGHSLKQ